MADYTPTFDPRLSGVSPIALLMAATTDRILASRRGPNAMAHQRRADFLEREAEERWLVHAAEVRVHIGPDGWVTALGAQAAFRSFVGAGR